MTIVISAIEICYVHKLQMFMDHELYKIMNMKEEETLAIAIDKLAALTGATIKNLVAATDEGLIQDNQLITQANFMLSLLAKAGTIFPIFSAIV
jgi:hypothetical protein